MCVIAILEPAHEDLRKIVAYISNENPNAAETLVRELLGEAMRLESLPGDLSGVRGRRNLRQI